MATPEEVQHALQNASVHFYTWRDDKNKDWWVASLGVREGTRQPTAEGALSALIRELTK